MGGPTSHDISLRDRKVQRTLLIEGCANVVVLAAKLMVGLATGSLAIIGDALHSLTDVANNVVGLIVVRHSTAPADDDHPYGHRKFETIGVFILATLLAVLAVELVIRALSGDVPEVATGPVALSVMLGVLAVNIGISVWEHVQGERLDSDILRADAKHTLADALTTVAVITGWQLAAHGMPWFDPVAAVVVAGIVAWFAYQLFRRVLPVLVDGAALDSAEVAEVVRGVDGVRDVGRVRSRWIGNHPTVDVIVMVDPALDMVTAHKIADAVEEVLKHRFGVPDTTVHVEPHPEERAGVGPT